MESSDHPELGTISSTTGACELVLAAPTLLLPLTLAIDQGFEPKFKYDSSSFVRMWWWGYVCMHIYQSETLS